MSTVLTMFGVLLWVFSPRAGWAAERLLGVQSARVMSQSMPWIAEELSLIHI